MNCKLCNEKEEKAKDNEKLRKFGMTEDEIIAWNLSADFANALFKLPALHPMEREEICHDIHKLQMRIMARPGMRAYGWKDGKIDEL